MSLAFTVVTDPTELYEFMKAKIWYSFEDQTAVFDSWAAASPHETQSTVFSGRAAQIRISNQFITGWPSQANGASATFYDYVAKWSGGCLRDYSSGMGGFCLLEDSDVNLADNNGVSA